MNRFEKVAQDEILPNFLFGFICSVSSIICNLLGDLTPFSDYVSVTANGFSFGDCGCSFW